MNTKRRIYYYYSIDRLAYNNNIKFYQKFDFHFYPSDRAGHFSGTTIF